MKQKTFSQQLAYWLKSSQPKTFEGLEEVFREKSIAIAIMLLMFLPALPLPTGGISHVFEVIAMLLALELVAGRETIWLPKRWRDRNLGNFAEKKVLPRMVRYIQWFEKFSRPRFSGQFRNRNSLRLVGLIAFIFTLFAATSLPFSGLDTLPSLGVVIIMLSVILEDGAVFAIGLAVGIFGMGVIISLGAAATELIKQLFRLR